MARMLTLAILSSFAASSMPTSGSNAPETWDDSDIVVVAEKLRKVKIDYSARGKKLYSCDVTQSSGDTRIDRIMCAILNACVKSGAQRKSDAKRCINDRIVTLENDPNAPPQGQNWEASDTSFRSASASNNSSQSEPILPPSQSGQKKISKIEPPREIENSIIVTAKPNPILSGKWEFHQKGTTSRMTAARFLPFKTWRICVPDSTLEQTVEAMLRDSIESDFVPERCRKWDIKMTEGKIAGEQRCVPRLGERMFGSLEGSVASEKVTIIRHVRLISVSGRASADDEEESVYEINGTRTGSCREK